MTIEEMETSIKDNATKAKAILTDEAGSLEEAQALLNQNDEIKSKIEALKSIDSQLLPQAEVKATNEVSHIMTNKIEFKSTRPLSQLPFEGNNDEKGQKAYNFGKLALALAGNKKAQDYVLENGLATKAVQEAVNADGGYLVQPELLSELIYLRAQYGSVRANADVRTMSTEQLWIPVMDTDASAYFVTEGAQITSSQPVFSRVEVVAKKMGIIVPVSSEVSEDAVIDLGSALARSMAWQFSRTEDLVCTAGTGASAAQGNIQGFITAGLGVSGNAGVVAAASGSAANWSATTTANLRSLVAALPRQYLMPGEVKFYMSRSFFEQVVCNRLDALSGNAALDLMNFNDGNPTLFGYPIVINDFIANTAAGTAGDALCAFGNLRQSAVLGDRRDVRIQVSDQFYWENDLLAYRGTQRFGFKAYRPGSSTEAGGITILKRTT